MKRKMRIKIGTKECVALCMLRYVLVFFIVACIDVIYTSLYAQEQAVMTGHVFTDAGEPIDQATIAIKGTPDVVKTDKNGRFVIQNIVRGAVLNVSHIGKLSREIVVDGGSEVVIVLEDDVIGMEEVIVTGYGTQRKVDLTGAISSVNTKDLQKVVARSATQALQGMVAGVDTRNYGLPGEGSKIRVRGVTSFGDSEPLVIVDGIEQNLNYISAQDVESIQVLKDARAAAIFGVRGANGVILVTTKKGKAGEPKILYNGYVGITNPLQGNVYDILLDSEEFMQVHKIGNPSLALFINGMPDYTYNSPLGSGVAFAGDLVVDPSLYFREDPNRGNNYLIQAVNKEGTDWFHEAFKRAMFTEHNLSVNGGTEKSKYAFSLGYQDEKGTLVKSFSERYTARINTEFNIGKNIRIGENANVVYRDYLPFNTGTEFGGIAALYKLYPTMPVKDIMGNWAGTWVGPQLGAEANPVAALHRSAKNSEYTNYNIVGNAYAEVDFLKNFTARTSLGYNIQNFFQQNWIGARAEQAEGYATVNRLINSASTNNQMTFTNTLNYKKIFDKHNIDVLIGSEAIKTKGRSLSGQSDDFFNDDYYYLVLGNGAQGLTASSGVSEEALFSLFGRADYNYDGRYLFGATVRRDGSSRFGPESRYGVFPSFSVGWRLSQEKFLRNISWLNELRLRGSYGIVGSQNNVQSQNQFSLYTTSRAFTDYDLNGTSNSIVKGYAKSRIGNSYTGWEENKVANIGFDLTAFNAFNFQLDFYKKSVNGLLFTEPLPAVISPSGVSSPTVNIGDIQNTGFDANVGYTFKEITKDLNASLSLNVTHYRNKIIKLPDPGYFAAGGVVFGDYTRNEVGYPMGMFYGYRVLGLFNTSDEIFNAPVQKDAELGRFQFLDFDGSDEITSDDRHFLANPHPKFTYGFTLNTDYKGFDLMAHFYGVYGNTIFNAMKAYTDFYQYYPFSNKGRSLLNAWTPTNTNTTIPKIENTSSFSTNQYFSSYFLESGSYFRLKTITLGYTINPEYRLIRSAKISNLRFYAQATNLFTITKYSGPDPDIAAGSNSSWGVDIATYPTNEARFTFGVNITF